MSPRTRATFAKRQKEQARQEKQKAKAERKQQMKTEDKVPADFELGSNADSVLDDDLLGDPTHDDKVSSQDQN